jgi:deoxyinosine 3'endonuclease (endonuclease V)
LFKRLKEKKPNLWPQVLLVDGNGIFHTRGFGCASHVGVKFDIPTIGVAKKTFDVDGLHKSNIRDTCMRELHKEGDVAFLKGDSGKIWAAALRSGENSATPIYVSIGHRVCLDTAIKITKLSIDKYRIPEPIRCADLRSR